MEPRPFVLLLTLLATPLCLAQERAFPSFAEGDPAQRVALSLPSELIGTQALATGEALRGLGLGNSTIALNPAGMSQAAVYHIEGMYEYGQDAELNGFFISIMDSKTQVLGVGLSYSYTDSTVDDIGFSGHNLRLALSYGFTKWLFFGLGGRYMNMDIEGTEGINAVTMDAGLLFRPLAYLSFGVTGHNLIYIGNPIAPITLGVGGAFGMSGFSFDFDWVLDFTTLDEFANEFHLGAQYLLVNMFPISAGYIFDLVRDRQFFSVGLGFVSANVGVEAAFKQQIELPENRFFGASIKVFL